jgi:CubicO group peptidase (beta-lactamase class C family)
MPGLTMTMEAVQKKMEDYCSALSNLGYLNGSVLVAYEGNVIFSKGYGMANFEHTVTNTPQTVFRIGSITKQFTATAILLLQELDLIHINDPISNCLPDYPNGEKITIHHLLTHTSGIPSFTSFIDYKKIMKHPTTLEEGVSKFKHLPLVFEPGEKYEYSNSGYLLLSYIIEKIVNKSFESYLDESILNALGMKQTGHDNIKKLLKNRASGYEVWGEVVNAEFIDMSVPSGAGAMYSTTEDLFIWGPGPSLGSVN